MENLNIPPFYVGQKVVCVIPSKTHGKHFSVKLNIKYTVSGIYFDPELILVGNQAQGVWVIELNEVAGIWWSGSFRKIQEQKFKAVTFENLQQEVEAICEN